MSEHKNSIIIIIVVIAFIALLVFGYSSYQKEKEKLTSQPPSAPTEFKANNISSTQIEFTWKDTSKNALDFSFFVMVN